jgi:hypothetical protein
MSPMVCFDIGAVWFCFGGEIRYTYQYHLFRLFSVLSVIELLYWSTWKSYTKELSDQETLIDLLRGRIENRGYIAKREKGREIQLSDKLWYM